MEKMIKTKEVIRNLKKVKKEKKLSNEKIYKLVKEKDFSTSVSLTTVNRVFRKGSEDIPFRYEATLRPIANALLDMEELEEGDNNETKTYKSILVLKQEIITELQKELDAKNETGPNAVDIEIAHYRKSIEHLHKQLDFREKAMIQLLDSNDRLQKANDRLQATIDKLTEQLLSCPYRGKGCKS